MCPEVARFLILTSLTKSRCPTLWLEGTGRPLVNKTTHHCSHRSAVYQSLRRCRCPASDNRATDGESAVISCFATSVNRRHCALLSKTTDALFPFSFFLSQSCFLHSPGQMPAQSRVANFILARLLLWRDVIDVLSRGKEGRESRAPPMCVCVWGGGGYHVRYDH